MPSPTPVIAAFLVLFVALGAWRGWLRVVTGAVVMVCVWLGLQVAGHVVVVAANDAYTAAMFTIAGGFDAQDANSTLRAIRASAPVDVARPETFYGALVFITLGLVYAVEQRFVVGPARWTDRALGAVAGLIDGYVVLFIGARVLSVDGRVVPTLVPMYTQVWHVLGQYIATVVVVAVVVIIAAAVAGTSRTPRRARSR